MTDMQFLEKTSRNEITSYTYKIKDVHTEHMALSWLYAVQSIEGIRINYFEFLNLNQINSDSFSLRLDRNISKPDFERQFKGFKSFPPDIILIDGTYKGKFVVIGISLIRYEMYINIENEAPVDIKELENKLDQITIY